MSLTKLKDNLNNKSRLLQQFPYDPHVRGDFLSTLKLYRKTRKKKIRDFKQNLINKLDMLREDCPRDYWRLLDQMTGTRNVDSIPDISGDTWHTYFKQLNKNVNPLQSPKFIESLLNMEKESIFSELDFSITLKEIQNEIKKFKE